MGTKPRAPLLSISGPKSDPSRLEVSTIAGRRRRLAQPRGDLEPVEVGELDVEQDEVRAEAPAPRRRADAPSAASPTTS